jgi:nickel-dependent lactate racemase
VPKSRGKIDLPFGKKTLSPDPPGRWQTLTPPAVESLSDPKGALGEALQNPLGAPPLAELARSGGRVIISLPDTTRPFPVFAVLSPILDHLNDAGVPDEAVTVLIATGIHRPLDEPEIRAHLGPARDRVEVLNHDPSEGLEFLGKTSRGTPVHVSEKIIGAMLVLSVGSTAFHFHAGFGGGPKGIVPGLAGRETARINHLLALSGPGDAWHPNCGPGLLDSNPVHEDLMEALALLPATVFIVNFVFGPSLAPVAVFAGGVRDAHRAACRVHGELFSHTVERPFDAVLASAGGAPRDGNLIQAHKAAAHGAGALREGGALVLVARCPEGWGHGDLPSWFEADLKGMRKLSGETGKKYVQTAYSLRDKATRFRFALFSELPGAEVERAGITALRDARGISSFLRDELGSDFRGLVLPDPSRLMVKGW